VLPLRLVNKVQYVTGSSSVLAGKKAKDSTYRCVQISTRIVYTPTFTYLLFIYFYLFISMTEHIHLQCNITAGQQGTNK